MPHGKKKQLWKRNVPTAHGNHGAFNSPDFNKISFLEKDTKIMILGSNPGEIQSSTELIDNIFYQNVNYIFNFTAKADQEDLLAMMGKKQM